MNKLSITVPVTVKIDAEDWNETYGADDTADEIAALIAEKVLAYVQTSHLVTEFDATITIGTPTIVV